MGRRLVTLASAVSLALCVASLWLWQRSRHKYDEAAGSVGSLGWWVQSVHRCAAVTSVTSRAREQHRNREVDEWIIKDMSAPLRPR